MPEPVPTPQPEEIVAFARILEESISDVEAAVSAVEDQEISDALWAQALDGIKIWNTSFAIGQFPVKSVGPVSFFETDLDDARLAFQNEFRRLYGFQIRQRGYGLPSTAGAAVRVVSDW